MRIIVSGLVLAAFVAMTSGCASSTGTKAGTQAGTRTAVDTKACVMQSGGRDVLRLSVSADAMCTSKDGALHIESHERHVHIWLVGGARTVDEAVGRVDQVIKSEFKDFRATGTTAPTIAGTPAKRLTGPGTEADDGDPGDADVLVFKTGDHVFVACTHGESLSSAARQWLLTVVQTAQAP